MNDGGAIFYRVYQYNVGWSPWISIARPAAMSGVMGITGWTRTPSNYYTQWGRAPVSTYDVTCSFPVAFPSSCASITMTPILNTGGMPPVHQLSITGIYNTHATARFSSAAISQSFSHVTWIAVGY